MKLYNNFNTKGFPEDLILGDFNNRPIPSTYYDITNDYDYDGTPIDANLEYNKRVEDEVVTNYKTTMMTALLQTLTPPNKIM